MKTELLGQEKNIVRVKVEFEAGEFTAGLNEAIGAIAQKASIPGFRKGHTPRRIIEMRLGRGGLYNEALENMIPDAIEQVVADYDLDTIAPPSLKVDEIREGQPLTCELTFEVTPEVILPELDGIEVEKLKPQVTEEMVEAMVQDFRMKHSTLSVVERPAGENDVLETTYVTQILNAGGSAPVKGDGQKGGIDLADSSVRPEIKEALAGKAKGESVSVDFDVDANDDHSITGRRIHYDFTVEEVKERIFPDMTPEFYKRALGVELDTEETFREEIKKRMLEHLNSENTIQASTKAINLIAGRSVLEIPDTLLNRQMDFLKERDFSESKRRFNKEMEEVLRLSSISPAEYEQGVRAKAMDIVRRTLVLDEIGRKFDVEVQKEEIEAEIARMAAGYQVEPAKLRAMFYKNQDRMMQIVDELRYDKIVRLVMEKVKVRDVDELTPTLETAGGDSETAEKAE